MATLDDSPSLFAGQQWTDWADALLPSNEEGGEDSDEDVDSIVTESMKLKIEDMPLFGLCPSRDEFYLVVCEKCQQVLKPQAFQAHLDVRHGGVGSYTISTKEHSSQSRHSSSKSHSKSHSPSKHHSRSSHSKSQSSSAKHGLTNKAPISGILTEICSGDDINPSINSNKSMGSYQHTKDSVCGPPHSFVAVSKVGAETHTIPVKDSKIKKNHSMPVVKVERMPDSLSVDKHVESYGSARTSLTNGAIRAAKSPSFYTHMEAVPDGIIDIKPPKSPTPGPPESPDVPNLMEPEPATISEIDSAVNAILEPSSPTTEDQDVSSYVSLATSPCTLTTTTVTMATVTSSLTTNVTNTTSTFTFSNMGRPHFPSGSIQVSFSSAGVLSTLSDDSSDTNISNNNNIDSYDKVTIKSDPDSTVKPSLCMRGSSHENMESTISDIVKSTVNANRTGGFQSLNPLVTGSSSSSYSLNDLVYDSALKSPTSQGNGNKLSGSSMTISKVGSKLLTGCSSANRLGDSSNSTVSSSAMASSSHSSNSDALKKLQHINKPDKVIPLKDRQYDANKHCGVVVAETGKPCTRSLTCKSHALSLRRAVQGRRLPFDELLKEHREAKEAYLKARVESKEAAAALKASTTPHKTGHMLSPSGKSQLLAQSPPVLKSLSDTNLKDKSHSSSGLSNSLKLDRQLSFNRSNVTNVQLPTTSVPEEVLSPVNKLEERLSIDEGEEDLAGKNDSYTNYHPRPIAACSFGARRHTNFGSNGYGCHSFNRRTDHLQAAFLDLLERHLNPPPPKKLCLESNLPKENQILNGTTDPYDFEMLDPTKTSLGQQLLQSGGRVIQTSVSRVTPKVKSKSNSNTGNKPKLKDVPTVTKTPTVINSSNIQTGGLGQKPSANLKRRSSGNLTPQSAGNTHPSLTGTAVVSTPNIIGSVGSLSNTSRPGSQFAIAIPNVNISAATLNQISASLVASGNLKQSKSNVIKDMGFVVTNIPQEALLNGQYVNIANAQIGDALSSNQFQQLKLEDGNKPTVQSTQLSKTAGQQKISINNNDAIRTVQIGKGNIITSLTPNAFLVDNSLPTRAILQPVSLSTPTGTPVVSVSGPILTQQHQRPVTTPSPQVLSGSDSQHVSTSPLPNGVVTASSDKEVVLSHHLPVFQSKTHRGTLQQPSHLIAGSQLPNHVTFQTAMATTTTNQNTGNASQLLTSQLSKIQMKNSNIQKSGSVNKLTVQPVSLTFPFMSGGGGFEIGTLGGQPQGHTLLITSEDAQKQGIQLHQVDTASNSPSNNVIS